MAKYDTADVQPLPFYEQLFPLVRQINQKLPPPKRIRVVAADPPIDWSSVTNQAAYLEFRNERVSSITSVVVKEVLSRKRKALLLFGEAHLLHEGSNSSVAQYERMYPAATFVIFTHHGFGSDNPLDVHNDKLEARMRSWPIPSLVPVRGTWLAELDLAYYFEIVTRINSWARICQLCGRLSLPGTSGFIVRMSRPAFWKIEFISQS
jgi:hypothetical protein